MQPGTMSCSPPNTNVVPNWWEYGLNMLPLKVAVAEESCPTPMILASNLTKVMEDTWGIVHAADPLYWHVTLSPTATLAEGHV